MKSLFQRHTDLIDISITLLCVCGSYVIASRLLSGTQFYMFDFAWRVSIILFVILVKRIQLRISKKQVLILGTMFLLELFVYRLLGTGMNRYLLLISVIAAPVMEELLFRGYIYERINGSDKRKILLSSIFFGLYHFKNILLLTPLSLIYQVLYAGIIVGPIFAWLRWRSGNIIAGILAHSLNNTLSEVFTRRLFPSLVGRRERFS